MTRTPLRAADKQIRGIGIDENDDICGVYTGRPTTSGVFALHQHQ